MGKMLDTIDLNNVEFNISHDFWGTRFTVNEISVSRKEFLTLIAMANLNLLAKIYKRIGEKW